MDEIAELKAKNEAIEKAKNDAIAEAEVNRKAREQAEMRANQLANEKAEREKLDDEAKRKKLEEDNEFKTLYERAEQRRIELENEIAGERKNSSITTTRSTILASYPTEVVDIATTAGLVLTDDSETAQEAFKATLDSLAEKMGVKTKVVVGNNGVTKVPATSEEDRSLNIARMRYSDPKISGEARRSLISKMPIIAEMERQAGLTK